MDKIRLGRTEMMVSRLGFGSIPIQKDSEDEAVAVVRRCLELGINYIDTANLYTTSEERIGKAISGRNEGLILATKPIARTREGVESNLKLSLKRLGVESIDLYQFHQVGDFKDFEVVLDPKGPMAVMEEAKKAGVVKHIGVTSHVMGVAKEAVKSGRFETIMFPFNFIAREAADELLPLAREHDVGFIAMKPLAGGLLDNFSIAFKYLFQFPDVLTLSGIAKVHEIEEIIQVLDGSRQMTEAEQREMQRLREELDTKFCRRCDYCLPCPEGIPIATVMCFATFVRRYPPEFVFSGFVAEAMEKAVAKMSICVKCRECEPRCPYGLKISQMVEEYAVWYQNEKDKYQKQRASR